MLTWAVCMAGKRGKRAAKDAARRAARSEMVQDLAAELAGAPDEVRLGNLSCSCSLRSC